MSDTLQNNTISEKIQDTKSVENPKLDDDGWTTVVNAKTKKRQKRKEKLKKRSEQTYHGKNIDRSRNKYRNNNYNRNRKEQTYQSKPKPEFKPKPKPEFKPKPELESKPEPEPESESKPEPEWTGKAKTISNNNVSRREVVVMANRFSVFGGDEDEDVAENEPVLSDE